MTLVESMKRLEALVDKLESKILVLERTYTKKEGDTIIEERLSRIKELDQQRKEYLEELDSKIRILERKAGRRSSVDPREDESFEDWKDRLLETVKEERRFSVQPYESAPDFKVTPENLDESLGVLREALDEVKEPQIEVGNRLWHQSLSERMEEKERLEKRIEARISEMDKDLEELKKK